MTCPSVLNEHKGALDMSKGIKVKILTDHNYFDIHFGVFWTKRIASGLEAAGIKYFTYKIFGEEGPGYYFGSIFYPDGKCIYDNFRLEKKAVDYFMNKYGVSGGTVLEIE